MVALLPYYEQGPLFNAYNTSVPAFSTRTRRLMVRASARSGAPAMARFRAIDTTYAGRDL